MGPSSVIKMGMNEPRIMSACMWVLGFQNSKQILRVISTGINKDCRRKKRQFKGKYILESLPHKDNALYLGWAKEITVLGHGTGSDHNNVREDFVCYSCLLLLFQASVCAQPVVLMTDKDTGRIKVQTTESKSQCWDCPINVTSVPKYAGFVILFSTHACALGIP